MELNDANKVAQYIIGTLVAILGLVNTLYGLLINPGGNLLYFLSITLSLSIIVFVALIGFVNKRKKNEVSAIDPTISRSVHYYPGEDRKKVTRIAAIFIALSVFSIVIMLFTDKAITPIVNEISVSKEDSEILKIEGQGFGEKTSDISVLFGDQSLTPTKIKGGTIFVYVPKGYSQSDIHVKRGPRRSNKVYFRYSGIVFDVAVLKLINPTDVNPIQQLMDKIEPFPAFPYYSHPSDDPSAWPPKVHEVRNNFADEIVKFLESEPSKLVVSKFKGEEGGSSLEVVSSSRKTQDLLHMQDYANLRMHYHNNLGSSREELINSFGIEFAESFLQIEEKREQIKDFLPNRIVIIKIQNKQTQDAKSFSAEISARGYVYDVTLNEEQGHSKSMKWSPNRNTVVIDVLPPGYTAEIRIWYQYLPLESRVFAGPADLLWEKTQGVRVQNLSISNGRVRRDQNLLNKLVAYERLEVDPTVKFESQF